MNTPRHDNAYKPFQEAAHCGGCGACARNCPAGAIKMGLSDEGFLWPVKNDSCRRCGRCEKICPVLHPCFSNTSRPEIFLGDTETPLAALAAASDISLLSPGEVESDPLPDMERIGQALSAGKTVFFSGAPCRVAGVKAVFGEPEKLLTADYFCAGLSSPQIKEYLAASADDPPARFRQACARRLILRASCSACPYDRLPRAADLTIIKADAGQYLLAANNPSGSQAARGAGFIRKARATGLVKLPGFFSQPKPAHRNRRLFFEYMNSLTAEENLRYNLDAKSDCIVLNFWHTPNYGGVLTAFALQEILKELGQRPRLAFCHVVTSLYEGNFQERFAARHLAITHRCSSLGEVEGLNDLTDTFIVGSDQVWRYEFAKNFNEIYYLGFVRPGHKKIAASVSFGRSAFDADPRTAERIGRLIADFEAVSVREKDGVKICRETFGAEATHLADPVLALDPEKYEPLIQESRRPDRGFIAVYGVDPSYGPELSKLSAKLNKPLVYIQNVEVADWLYLVKNCDVMATGSFHGACFALLWGRPFIYCQTPGTLTLSRLESLLPDFGQTARHIRPGGKFSDLDHLFRADRLDFANISQVIGQKRLEFRRWLKAALQKRRKQ